MSKDWTGNYHSVCGCLGARNECLEDREEHDYYATQPIAIEWLMKLEKLNKNIWECACGEGHLAKPLIREGYNVKCTDLIDRGFGAGGWTSCKRQFHLTAILSPIHLISTHRNLLRRLYL